ncbi:MAG: endonuclease III [Clostridia bacterium]|nr:endonuclease III [Clostridia bacterium]
MTLKEKKERMARIVSLLKDIYPEALCSLEYGGEGWKLLIMGRLSAQCTDERVNIVCRELFKKFPTLKSIADAQYEDIEEMIKSCGLYRMKAKNIKDASARLYYEYNSIIPDDMDELLKFEGVGRKIANLLLGDLYKKPAIVADTHCMRICGRFGMYKEGKKNPLFTEKTMSQIIDPSEQSDFCHRMVLFGREFCTAQSPKCSICPLSELCQHNLNNKAKKA